MSDHSPPASFGVQVRGNISGLPLYVPGRKVVSPAGQVPYKLSSNELPFGPLPEVTLALTAALQDVNIYPDLVAEKLRSEVGQAIGLPPDWIALGTGSVAVLGHLVTAFCDPGSEVIFPWRSFEAYPIVVQAAAGIPRPVPLLSDGNHDLPTMALAVNQKTSLIFLCTPNNPTGNTIKKRELKEFLDRVPSRVLVVIDEAYLEFNQDMDSAKGIELIQNYDNIALLRTFSKAYGLAGLRVGYAVARPRLSAAIRCVSTPFGVSGLAQVAASAALSATQRMAERIDCIIAERERMYRSLVAEGWSVPKSGGNFLWLALLERSADFALLCAQEGIAVRAYADEGVRVTIGLPVANDRILALARQFRASGP
jgi:histidinol-phosphate aminotransferase